MRTAPSGGRRRCGPSRLRAHVGSTPDPPNGFWNAISFPILAEIHIHIIRPTAAPPRLCSSRGRRCGHLAPDPRLYRSGRREQPLAYTGAMARSAGADHHGVSGPLSLWSKPKCLAHDEHAHAPHPLGLLRPPSSRPCSRCAPEERDESRGARLCEHPGRTRTTTRYFWRCWWPHNLPRETVVAFDA
jgi:hypothetical protein